MFFRLKYKIYLFNIEKVNLFMTQTIQSEEESHQAPSHLVALKKQIIIQYLLYL